MDLVKILYVGFFGLPDHDASANRVMNNAKLIQKSGYEVLFLDEQNEYKWANLRDSKRIVHGFTVYSQRRPKNRRDFIRKMVSIDNVKKVIDDIGDVKVVIAYNYPSIALDRLYKHYKGKIKICSDCTEWYSGSEYKFPLNIMSSLDSLFRMRFVNKRIDGVICISSFLYDYYGHKRCNVLLPPLVDLEEKIWNQNELDYDENYINMIYGGSPGRNKEKMSPIIRSVCESKYKDKIVLRIVGITKQQYLDLYPKDKEILAENKKRIIFYGRITHKEYIQMLISSAALIFVRIKSRVTMAGFSTKFVEAVSAGVPVVTTDTSDMKCYIDQYNLGYIMDSADEITNFMSSDDVLKLKKTRHARNYLFDYRDRKELEDWLEYIIEE